MKNILLTYSTLSGNTEIITKTLYGLVVKEHSSIEFHLEAIDKVDIKTLKKFDLIIFGASSTGDGELNPDAEDFFSLLGKEKVNLNLTNFALFGIGDRAYSNFCGAIDTIKEKILDNKGKVLLEPIKLEGYPASEAVGSIKEWVEKFI